MSTAHSTPHRRAARAGRAPAQQPAAEQHPHGGGPVRSALRKAGIVVGTVARVTLLGRDGVDL
ncbi:hypothetical protein ACIQGZ_27330 [Streptomyces sp. NPDC092296]|uniref:hypothetical protein n=1 Tax=Streptomyces sp. NPDC092296 TaxID=3366012 RepID=UPI003804A04D